MTGVQTCALPIFKTVQSFNVTVREFPTNLTAKMFGYDVKPNFAVADEKAVTVAPRVEFGKSALTTPSVNMAPAVPVPAAPTTAPADSTKKGG